MKTLLAAALIFLLIPSLALASPVTFGFTGLADFGFGPFSGSYTFDSNGGPADGEYIFDGAPYGMTIIFPNFTLNWTGLTIRVFNDVPSAVPTFITDSYTVVVSDGFNPTVIGLRDCDGSTFTSNALPLSIDLNAFRPNCSLGNEVVIAGAVGNQGIFTVGTLTSLFVAEKVPEPASWLLLGLGLIVILVFMALRNSQTQSGVVNLSANLPSFV